MAFPLLEFFAGLTLMLAGSRWLPAGIERLGRRLRSRSGHLGLLTALGANSPEITAGVTALVSGAHDAGYGVVLGSNLFNLAGLLGVGAVVAGRVALRPPALTLHGAVGVAITLVAVALVRGDLPVDASALAIATIFGAYVVLLGLSPATLERLPGGGMLAAAAGEEELAVAEQEEQEEESAQARARRPSRRQVALSLGPPLACIVLGGVGVMRSSLVLAARLGLPRFLVAGLLLAFLTGLPNLYTALRLARAGRGRAVVSETLNSNTLNIIVGVTLPALAFGTGRAGGQVELAAWWLLGSTLVALGLTAVRGGLGRCGGLLVVGLYLGFVTLAVVTAP